MAGGPHPSRLRKLDKFMRMSHRPLLRKIVAALLRLTSAERLKFTKASEDFVSHHTGGLYDSVHDLVAVHDGRVSFERRQKILKDLAHAYEEADLSLLRVNEATNQISFPKPGGRSPSQVSPELTGYIYLMSNEAMPGLLKVGFTAGLVEDRREEVGASTGVPIPFKIERTFPVYEDIYKVERDIHDSLSHCRVNKKREFFRISVEKASRVIEPIVARACTSLFVKCDSLDDWKRQL